jgi:hypothetical protein
MSLGERVRCRDDVGAHAQLARGLDGNGCIVAGHHLDPHALLIGEFDRLLGVVTGRIEHRQYTKHRPAMPAIVGAGNTERA